MSYILKKLLSRKKMSFKLRAKNLLFYLSRKKWAKKSWKNRHKKVFERNKEYKQPLMENIELEHKKIWSLFGRSVDPDTLRICGNISGNSDPRIVPEDIFVSDIEPTLNINPLVNFLSHKSFYNRWYPKGIFPADILHNIEGKYLDADLSEINFETIKEKCGQIKYPVVFKPNSGSYGGDGIRFIENSEQLIRYAQDSVNFVVQEQIKQHNFFTKYNTYGLNTFRVNLYRSVTDNKLHIINISFRMGVGGSLDNETAGGIHTYIDENGKMNGYAVDKYASKFTEHPDSGLTFDEAIPDFNGLKKLCLKVGNQVFLARIIGLDACYDENGKWRIIEINTEGSTIRFSQYGGRPFFGKFTAEVIDYCKIKHWTIE